jgi:hypothetical protein
MAYTVNKTSGAVLTTISDGTIDTTTDLILIGKNYAGYGEFLNENMVKMLENFANTSAPSSPLAGQMWWDTTNSLLKVYSGTAFKTVSSSTASATAPTTGVTGDLWWDTTNGQLKVYNGTTWITIGPAFTSGTGTSGSIVETVTDSGATDHVVVKLYVNNTVVGTISKSTVFTPQSALSGFATISPGIQISSTVTGAKFQGTATDSDKLGGSLATAYLRVDQSDSTTGVFSVLNDTGMILGVDSDLTIGINGSSNPVFTNANTNGSLVLAPNGTGTVDVSSKRITNVATPTASTDSTNKSYVDTQLATSGDLKANGSVAIAGILSPDANNTRNLGTGSLLFATIYATTFSGNATTATTATNSTSLGGQAAANYLRSNASDSTSGVLSILNDTGMILGVGGDLTIGINGSSNPVFTNTNTNGSIIIAPNGTGTVDVSSKKITSVATPTASTDGANKAYVDAQVGGTGALLADGSVTIAGILRPDGDNTRNLGTSSVKFATIYATTFSGKATSAQYADVAENFTTDARYTPGTVVALGGVEEITAAVEDLANNVFGVVSNKPAYLMNAGLKDGIAVAVTGRVPVKVTGTINKGDRLVSAGNGIARAAIDGEATFFNVIGRAIESKIEEEEGLIEAFVTIN